MVAAEKGRTEVVIALLDRGADIEAKNGVSENNVFLLAASGGGYVYYVVVWGSMQRVYRIGCDVVCFLYEEIVVLTLSI